MPIDYSTAAGQLRLLISDTDEPDNVILGDPMVEGFLGMHGLTPTATDAATASVKRAAADALDAIATSETLISKVMRTQAGVSTDGARVAEALRAHARSLREQADDDEDTGVFEVAEFTPWPVTGL